MEEDGPPDKKRPKTDAAAKFRRGPEVATRRVSAQWRAAGKAMQPRDGSSAALPALPPPLLPPPLPASTAACLPLSSSLPHCTPHPTPHLLQIEDKKLKGRLRYSERVFADAQLQAAKVDEWLLPADAGALEADGPLEQTWRFSQQEIVQVGW